MSGLTVRHSHAIEIIPASPPGDRKFWPNVARLPADPPPKVSSTALASRSCGEGVVDQFDVDLP